MSDPTGPAGLPQSTGPMAAIQRAIASEKPSVRHAPRRPAVEDIGKREAVGAPPPPAARGGVSPALMAALIRLHQQGGGGGGPMGGGPMGGGMIPPGALR